MDSADSLAFCLFHEPTRYYLRGKGGRISCFWVVWKAATGAARTLSRTKALRTDGRKKGEVVVANFEENARFDAAAKPVCLRRTGRTIEAIVNYFQSLASCC
jgi:hypothetical protein